MTSKAILDTDILSEIYKGVDQIVLSNAAEYIRAHAQLSFTSVSVHEVLFGYYAKGAVQRAEKFARDMTPHDEITPTPADYRLAAQIRGTLQRAGTPIGALDPLIAACAIERELPLVTGNTRHHSFIQGAGYTLRLLNWREL